MNQAMAAAHSTANSSGGGGGGGQGGVAEEGRGMDIQEQIRRIREKYEQSGGNSGTS